MNGIVDWSGINVIKRSIDDILKQYARTFNDTRYIISMNNIVMKWQQDEIQKLKELTAGKDLDAIDWD